VRVGEDTHRAGDAQAAAFGLVAPIPPAERRPKVATP